MTDISAESRYREEILNAWCSENAGNGCARDQNIVPLKVVRIGSQVFVTFVPNEQTVYITLNAMQDSRSFKCSGIIPIDFRPDGSAYTICEVHEVNGDTQKVERRMGGLRVDQQGSLTIYLDGLNQSNEFTPDIEYRLKVGSISFARTSS